MSKVIVCLFFIASLFGNIYSQNVEALLKKCEAEKNQKLYEQAIATCTEAIKLSPRNDEAYYLRGVVYELMPDKRPESDLQTMLGGWQGKNLKLAEADYKKVVELKPNVSFNWWLLGRIQLQTHDDKQMDEPIKNFSEAIRVKSLNPNDYLFESVYFYRAEAYRRYNAGIDVSDIYAEENKMLDKAGQDALNEKRKREENYRNLALADYAKYISLDKTNDAQPYFSRANLYNSLRKYDLALADLNKHISITKDTEDAFLMRGQILLRNKQYAKAIEDFTEVIEMRNAELVEFDPTDFQTIQALLYRAEAYKALGKKAEACKDLTDIGREADCSE